MRTRISRYKLVGRKRLSKLSEEQVDDLLDSGGLLESNEGRSTRLLRQLRTDKAKAKEK